MERGGNKMTIYELLELFSCKSTQKVEIWDCSREGVIYKGNADDVPCEYDDLEVCSLDNLEKTEYW